MVDYECPACGGGFPASDDTADGCPWCGESMDGGGGDSRGLLGLRTEIPRVPPRGDGIMPERPGDELPAPEDLDDRTVRDGGSTTTFRPEDITGATFQRGDSA